MDTGATKSGAYDLVHNISLFMKKKRKMQDVILAPEALKGRTCFKCGKDFTKDASNRADLHPAKNGKVEVKVCHYDCAWATTIVEINDHITKVLN